MLPSRSLPPVELWRGVRPRKAANSRPSAKALMSGIVATIAEAVTGPTPGMVIRRRALSSAFTDAFSVSSIASISSSIASICRTSGASEARTPSGTRISPCSSAPVLGQPLQRVSVLRPLRRDDANLCQMPAQGVQQPRAVARQRLADAMTHQLGLVLDRSDRHEAHARTPDSFANPPRVGRVVLVAPHIRLHISGRDQLHAMAEFDQFARPVMRGAASLDPDQASRKRAKKRKQVAALDRLGDDDPALRVYGVNLEHVLGQIQPDACDRRQIADRLTHGRLPFRWRFVSTTTILAHRDADRGAVHPITVIPAIPLFRP